jgi:hypothetical protein
MYEDRNIYSSERDSCLEMYEVYKILKYCRNIYSLTYDLYLTAHQINDFIVLFQEV